jgi:hypothetical protein
MNVSQVGRNVIITTGKVGTNVTSNVLVGVPVFLNVVPVSLWTAGALVTPREISLDPHEYDPNYINGYRLEQCSRVTER